MYETAYAERTGDRCDGCLTFWHRSKFLALRTEGLQMRRFGLKDNVALLVLLAPLLAPLPGSETEEARPIADPSAPALLIGNTHLLFNPKRGDIKVRPLSIFSDLQGTQLHQSSCSDESAYISRLRAPLCCLGAAR